MNFLAKSSGARFPVVVKFPAASPPAIVAGLQHAPTLSSEEFFCDIAAVV